MATVAILGAGGTIGPAIVRDLAESDEVDALRALDLDGARAECVVSTGSVAAATARLLLRDALEVRGALPLERCLPAEALFDELARVDTSVDVRVREVTAP